MREVIRIDKKEEEKERVVFTHILFGYDGWSEVEKPLSEYPVAIKEAQKIVYLGKDCGNGDMFAVYSGGDILIYKGHLNSGKY
jgi:hypothetical protein